MEKKVFKILTVELVQELCCSSVSQLDGFETAWV
jgi:hypothetical protein